MARCRMVRCGMIWFCIIRCGMVRCDAVRHNIRCGIVRLWDGKVQCGDGKVRCGIAGKARDNRVRCGMVR